MEDPNAVLEEIRLFRLRKIGYNTLPINKTDILELFYLTSIENIPSILQHGILSHKRANRKFPTHKDIADDEVQERRASKFIERVVQEKRSLSLHQHAPLFLNPQNAMIKTCKEKNKKKLCILRIYPSLLERGDVVLTNRNASTDEAVFFTVDAFQLSPRSSTIVSHSDPLYDGRYITAPQENKQKYKKVRAAEVLTPYEISSEYIGGIFVPCEETLEEVRAILQKERKDLYLEINASIFHLRDDLIEPPVVQMRFFSPLKTKRPQPTTFQHIYPESSDSEGEVDNFIELRRQ